MTRWPTASKSRPSPSRMPSAVGRSAGSGAVIQRINALCAGKSVSTKLYCIQEWYK